MNEFEVGDRVRFIERAIAIRSWHDDIRADRKAHTVTRLMPHGDVVLDGGDCWSSEWLEAAND